MSSALKAIHQPFDHDKLMMVTRVFARDHGLALPEGYARGGDDRKKKSLYEMQQQKSSGITKEERMAAVTAAWNLGPRSGVRVARRLRRAALPPSCFSGSGDPPHLRPVE